MQYQIYWTPQTQLDELQGAVLDFKKEDEVTYKNDFLPSGQRIVSWTDSDNYFQNKRIGQLPQLVAGKSYRSRLFVTNSDRMHAYLSWVFYDEKKQVIQKHYQNVFEETFTVPEGYASYRVALLSAGTGQFAFHKITVSPVVDGELVSGDQQVNDHLVAYRQQPSQLTSKTLRVILAEPRYQLMDLPIQAVQPSPQAVLFLTIDFLKSAEYFDEAVIPFLQEQRKAVKAKGFEFVGYGPISTFAALKYREAMKEEATVVIPESNDLVLPAGYDRHHPALQTFLQALPDQIQALQKESDVRLKKPSLGPNPSSLQAVGGQEELLRSLTYLDWPVDKKKVKQVKKEKKQQKARRKKSPDHPSVDTKPLPSAPGKEAAKQKEEHQHGERKRQLVKASHGEHEKRNSSQMLQDFFTKNRH